VQESGPGRAEDSSPTLLSLHPPIAEQSCRRNSPFSISVRADCQTLSLEYERRITKLVGGRVIARGDVTATILSREVGSI
jgi:hypothetical protein